MAYQIIRVLRALLKLAAIVFALLLLAGFVAQFLRPERYPWVLDAWRYTWPVTHAIARYLPTTYQGINVSLLLALVLLWILYAVIERGLWMVEDALRGRLIEAKMTAARKKALELAQTERPSPASPTTVARKAPEPAQTERPSPASPDSSMYRSEAIAVIDLVKSTNLVTQFGNTFLLKLKHRLEHVVTPISFRHEASYSESTGDGFLIFFSSVAKAVAAFKEIFQALPSMNEGLPEEAEVALRASLNFGEVIVGRDARRTGSAVHKTFRIEAVDAKSLVEAEGGIRREEFPEKNYILVSEEAHSGLAKVPGLQCRFLGLCDLKGFPGLHRVYQIQWEELSKPGSDPVPA